MALKNAGVQQTNGKGDEVGFVVVSKADLEAGAPLAVAAKKTGAEG